MEGVLKGKSAIKSKLNQQTLNSAKENQREIELSWVEPRTGKTERLFRVFK